MSLLSFIPTRSLDLSSMQEIGHGAERRCFVSSRHPHIVYKCSKLDNCKQSIKEAAYYQHLHRRHVPMTHLPRIFGIFKTSEYFVTVQEFICDTPKIRIFDLPQLVSNPNFDMRYIVHLQNAYTNFRDYLLNNRIVTNDSFAHNFKIKIPRECEPLSNSRECNSICNKVWKLILIDGIGAVSLIPVTHYVRFMAEKRIHRQCLKFVNSVKNTSKGRIVLTPFD